MWCLIITSNMNIFKKITAFAINNSPVIIKPDTCKFSNFYIRQWKQMKSLRRKIDKSIFPGKSSVNHLGSFGKIFTSWLQNRISQRLLSAFLVSQSAICLFISFLFLSTNFLKIHLRIVYLGLLTRLGAIPIRWIWRSLCWIKRHL